MVRGLRGAVWDPSDPGSGTVDWTGFGKTGRIRGCIHGRDHTPPRFSNRESPYCREEGGVTLRVNRLGPPRLTPCPTRTPEPTP